MLVGASDGEVRTTGETHIDVEHRHTAALAEAERERRDAQVGAGEAQIAARGQGHAVIRDIRVRPRQFEARRAGRADIDGIGARARRQRADHERVRRFDEDVAAGRAEFERAAAG